MAIFARNSLIVFSMRQVMVIGPTPPGTGVITEARGSTAELAGERVTVDADIDYNSPWSYHIGSYKPRTADGDNENFGLPCH